MRRAPALHVRCIPTHAERARPHRDGRAQLYISRSCLAASTLSFSIRRDRAGPAVAVKFLAYRPLSRLFHDSVEPHTTRNRVESPRALARPLRPACAHSRARGELSHASPARFSHTLLPSRSGHRPSRLQLANNIRAAGREYFRKQVFPDAPLAWTRCHPFRRSNLSLRSPSSLRHSQRSLCAGQVPESLAACWLSLRDVHVHEGEPARRAHPVEALIAGNSRPFRDVHVGYWPSCARDMDLEILGRSGGCRLRRSRGPPTRFGAPRLVSRISVPEAYRYCSKLNSRDDL